MKQKSLIEPVTMVRRLFRPTGCILFAILLFDWSGVSLISASSSEPKGIVANSSALEEAFKKFDSATQMDSSAEALDATEKAMGAASREGFDVRVKAAQLGKDVDKIFAFVRDEVRFEAYMGVLRGAPGALMARAGNSFDRSLLLGSLLQENGFEVRYAHAVLDDEKASLLISTMFSTDFLPAKPEAGVEGNELPEELKVALQGIAKLTIARWQDNVHSLQAALRPKANLWDEQPRSLPALVPEVRNHVWVEYRHDDAWIALDPSAASVGLKPGETFAKAKETWRTIPLTMYHKVTLLVLQEEQGADSRTTREMLNYEARADELDAAEVVFRFDVTQSGMGWSATPVLSMNGRSIRGRKSAGNGMDAGAANLGARLFSHPGEQPKKGAGEPTAAWLEFRFTSPAGTTETLRREIFDRVGVAKRASLHGDDAPLAMLPAKGGIPLYVGNQYAFSFSSGPIHSGLVQSYLTPHLAALRAAYPLAKKLRTENRAPTEVETHQLGQLLGPALPAQLGALAQSFHTLSFETLALARHVRSWERLRFYAASPRLAIASVEPRLDGNGLVTAVLSLDLRRNDLRAVGKDMNAAQIAWANVVRGVRDAVLEDIVLRINLPFRDRADLLSTVAILDRAGAQTGPLSALTSAEDITRIKAPEAIRSRMIAGVGQGVLLVASQNACKIQDTDRLGWWHIDMASGETLGIMDTGLHQSTQENASVISLLVIACSGAFYTFAPRLFYTFLYTFMGWHMEPEMLSDDIRDPNGTNGSPVR